MNYVILTGRLTKDPEIRVTASGKNVCSFTLAVNRAGAKEKTADFISCLAWDTQALNLAKFIKKGGLIGVEGSIQVRSYQAQDGSTRYVTEVMAHRIEFLESANKPQAAPQPQNYGYTPVQAAPQPQAAPVQAPQPQVNSFANIEQQFEINDDDLPF